MAQQTLKRIISEHKNLQSEQHLNNYTACPSESSLFSWTAIITAPATSAYPSQTFHLNINLPDTYPRHPPTMTFTTPIFHPNIEANGEVWLAEFQARNWSPAFTIRVLLISLQVMLGEPNVEEGCVGNEEAARLWREDREGFMEKVRNCDGDV
ncbi:hypothetical protein AUEXF2481DRAFT_30165 [Aureobasidium subglaciale EXF-2481]|uniref:UBC core domain-containing protein n=1 Tax=Aureobasidium subglaciale (strain EXF-2481) TaxID=1043005 RepID=A0A074YAK9_AURSE|nr:uncharacterized protein AUEXF2481DRAFT_30165 [Aureobasidium subglaciale EXF-2481]KEQ94805.1 hypothetical protein AUEXF2481DRAFT_30165 [Aureobasidium subglaciale EXF-2481]